MLFLWYSFVSGLRVLADCIHAVFIIFTLFYLLHFISTQLHVLVWKGHRNKLNFTNEREKEKEKSFSNLRPHSLIGWWLGSRVVSVLDSGAEGPGFKSQPRRCWVTVFGQANCSHPLCLCSPSSKIGSSPLKVGRITAGLVESNGSLPPSLWLFHMQADCQEPGWAPESYALATFTFLVS